MTRNLVDETSDVEDAAEEESRDIVKELPREDTNQKQ